ncbi:MAG: cobalamin-dependent protein [Clostridiales bacterium]|jgi:methanogenic corrinoid protein MtbC1|nr:cobalamin-dependent protein [Eubacteriales bacterium]MDH7565458.1 cobalamin-dependent protein [Clostridiales bacterium]
MNESLLIAAMVRLDEDKVLTLARHSLENGIQPLNIIEQVQKGLSRVLQMYEQGICFLSDLMMSAEIFISVIELLKVEGGMAKQVTTRPIVVGTVKNDIHDIGKNIMVQLLRCKGFNVIDLGVDVSPERFVLAAAEYNPKLMFLSGLLTISHQSMRLTIEALEKSQLRGQIKIIISGLVDEEVRQFVHADYYINDSFKGLKLCQSLLTTKKKALIS